MLWIVSKRIDIKLDLAGAMPDETPEEQELLGQLVELPHFRVMQRYFARRRWDFINNAMPRAKDLKEVGEVIGSINMANMWESDMFSYFDQLVLRRQSKELQANINEEWHDPADAEEEVELVPDLLL